ncbi:hypothetical protein C3L33_15984, partial [Rhododendron williamsianum]
MWFGNASALDRAICHRHLRLSSCHHPTPSPACIIFDYHENLRAAIFSNLFRIGRIFDVTTGKSFYGPGGDYAMFAGKDASRALAKMSKDEDDVVGSLHGLSDKEMGVLNDWEKKFEAKYPIVGRVAS